MNMPNSNNSNRRFQVVEPVVHAGKTIWSKLGRAFENPPKEGKGPSITVRLEVLPSSHKFMLFEDVAREEGEPE